MPTILGLQPPTLLQAVLDNVGVGLVVVDKEGRIVFHNQAARNMFGATDNLSAAEWRRRNYKLHDTQGREIPAEQGPIVRALAGEVVKPQEVRVTLPDGSIKWLHVAADPFSVLGLAGVFVLVADETEQIDLRKAVERLQRIGEFAILAGGLAHDFNNILSVVSNNVALALGDEGIQEITRTRLEEMAAALKKGATLVGRLMQYSSVQDTTMRPLQINGVVSSALDLARPLIRSRVRVKIELAHALPAAQGDPSRLEQVLVNLILNALDAMPDGGELALCTTPVSSAAVPGNKDQGNKQFVLITVADTGIGIPENIRSSIFDPFFTTKPGGERAGLGLSSAQAIVRQHNGHIEVQSAPGAGTTFKIFLPVTGG
jgi:two-component system, cell cycle sensor histidine kinase and response regulator CckA